MKWIVAPLVAALLVVTSGYLSALEDTTDATEDLVASSREAPKTTAEAAAGVGTLPQIAALTTQQSSALKALADALEASAERVADLNGSIDDQSANLGRLGDGLADVVPQVDCIRSRITRLQRASDDVAPSLDAITATLGRLIASQDRSIRHTRSINRKLAALGVVATIQGVEPPPPPSEAPAPEAGQAPPGREC
jgi:hypothetical protein